jgi:hypothetical protein
VKKPVGSEARTRGEVRPTQDPTEDAMNFDEEHFEKTLRLWAGIIFSGVPVQSRRVWRGFGDDHATRFAEENFEGRSFPRPFIAEAAHHPRTESQEPKQG